jgi:hypothetical protein
MCDVVQVVYPSLCVVLLWLFTIISVAPCIKKWSVSQVGEEGSQTIFNALCVFACPTEELWVGAVSPVPTLL